MKTSTHIIRLGRTLALAAFVAGAVVPAALAGHPGNAVSITKSSGNAVLDGRSPDTRDAALAAQVAKYGPRDGWYGYAVSLTKSSRNAVLDGRSPDTVDAALLTHTQVVKVVPSSSFGWGDFGVGAGSGIGLILLCGGGLVLAYQRRHRPQAA